MIRFFCDFFSYDSAASLVSSGLLTLLGLITGWILWGRRSGILREELGTVRSELDTLNVQNTANLEKLSVREADISKLDAQANDLRTMLHQRDNEMAGLQEQLGSAAEANTRWASKYTFLETENLGLRTEMDGLKTNFVAPEIVVTPEADLMPLEIVEAVVVAEPVVEIVAEPVVEIEAEPVVEIVAEPVVEIVAEPVAEIVAEPVVEIVAEPVAEIVAEPVAEIDPIIVSEPVKTTVTTRIYSPEPAKPATVTTRIITPEPVVEVTPEPIVEEVAAPAVTTVTKSKVISIDNLERIEGIGAKSASLFKDAGIYTFAEMSNTPVERLQQILTEGGERFNMLRPETWPIQAGLLARGELSRFDTYVVYLTGGVDIDGRGAAFLAEGNRPALIVSPTGQRSDNLTVIEGIGPKIAEILTASGIGTWQAVAASSPDAIKQILLAASSRYGVHNPSTWPEQAQLLSDQKWDEFKHFTEYLNAGKKPD
jgi:predicted flap endonuclease-1-like 5' DNA nuclease